MLPFSESDLAFLKRHGFSTDDVYDGRGQSKYRWRSEAKRLDKPLVFGTACGAAGHRLRTRSGHCVQCDPKKIAFQRRHINWGYVYIAGSLSGRVVKIGTAMDPDHRKNTLPGYGGLKDWKILYSEYVEKAGWAERDIANLLARYATPRPYQRDGSTQQATEILNCSYSVAKAALETALKDDPRSEIWESPRHSEYEFSSAQQ